ncbi:MAG: divergent polysaccharide deacetylase family protein [Candidatus Omnitrophota bacterium]|nr:MAG: divergent polysaccharide deacetylase family protein [Candidatus Omnitrophota bacterium]
MVRTVRIIFFAVIILTPLILYKSFEKKERGRGDSSVLHSVQSQKPKIALIFDDLGKYLEELKEVHSLDIPLTVSILPGLKFSKNVSHISSRCGYSVFIHLPLEPRSKDNYQPAKLKFISESLSRKEIDSLLRYYLNYMRIAIGVNNHMGSKATEDEELMKVVMREIKRKDLIFIDSRTSQKSVAYRIAKEEGVRCGYNEGFLDAVDDLKTIEAKLAVLVEKAKEKGKIIVIAHPRKNTLKVLRKKLPELRDEVVFVTIKDYFGL